MRYITLTAAVLMLAGCGSTQDPAGHTNKSPSKHQAEDKKGVSNAAPAAHEHAWRPAAFRSTESKLTPNSTEAFFLHYTTVTNRLTKGEYETTQEYISRTSNKNAILKPFSTKVDYAFVPRYAQMDYNADKQEYTLMYSSLSCSLKYPFNSGVACGVDNVTESSRNYVGQNSFGAVAKVDSASGKDFYFVFPSSEFRGKRYKDADLGHQIPVMCRVPIAQARRYSGKTIKAAIVVSLSGAKELSGIGRTEDPTVSSPHQKYFDSVGIPANLKYSLCFVQETGEILHINHLH